MTKGTIAGFDAATGCWTIRPNDGGPVVFAHADDFGTEIHPQPGLLVRFSVLQGTYALKAYNLTPLIASFNGSTTETAATCNGGLEGTEMAICQNYISEIINVLTSKIPGITYPQVVSVCEELAGQALGRGWLDR